LIEELDPGVILVDIVLGFESGFDLVRRLVQRVDTAGSRSILISTHTDGCDRRFEGNPDDGAHA
jgi:DNA-binding NarL/FixJ family response regulator